MPRHWRCGNAHDWVGDLGALTYCPVCGSADVYEIRGPLPVEPPPTEVPPGSSPSISTLIIPAPVPPPADQTWKQSVPGANTQASPEEPGMRTAAPPGAVGSVHEQITREMPAGQTAEQPAAEADSAPSTWIHESTGPAAQTDTLSGPPAQPVTAVAGPPPAPPAPAASTPGANGAPAPAPPSRGVPHVAGYDILGVLGRGGMGVVYKARQQGLNRLVALKMVLGGVFADSAGQSRFRAEAEAIAALQHPNIVQVYEVGEHDGLPYFSLEYLDGGSLQDRLAGRPLPPREAAVIIEQLARAVQYAHEHGIVHRDLKPGNILFKKSEAPNPKSEIRNPKSEPGRPVSDFGFRTSDLSPKVTDFGLARRLGVDSNLTATGTVLGTPSYMAPEQAEGKSHAIGPPADIHALGAILYEMLTGRPPFLGADPTATVMQVRMLEPVPPRRGQPDVPRDLETIVLKCLQKEPHKRYATASALADDLARFLSGAPIQARPVSLWEKVWKWARRNPASAGLVVLGSAVVLGLAVGGPVVAHRERELYLTAVQERNNAQRQFLRAKENFDNAREAVEKVLTRFVDERLRNVPLFEKVRAELVEEALVFYGRFLRESDEPAVRQEAGWAYQRVGYIRDLLGQRADAIAAYQKAIALFTRLATEAPANTELQRDLADTHRLLAVALEADGRRVEADRSYDIARDVLTRLVEEHRQEPEYRLRLGKLLNDRGDQLGRRGQFAEAEGQLFAALGEFDRLCNEYPTAARRLERARVQSSLGALLLTQKQPGPALAQLRAAVDTLADLVRDPDDRFEHVKELGRALDNLGTALLQSGQTTAAEATFRSAVKQLTDLADGSPSVPEYRYAQALALDNLAHLQKTTGSLRTAEPDRARAREVWAKLVADVPSNVDYQFRYALSLDEYGIYLDATDRRPEALRAVGDALDRLRKLAAADPTDLTVARELARRHLNLGILLTRDRQETEGEDYYARADLLLEGVLERTPKNDDVRLDLITVHTNRAALMRHLGRAREEEASWRRVAKLQEQRIEAFPRDADLAADLARTQFALAGLCRDRSDDALPILRSAFDRQCAALALGPRRSDLVADLAKYGTALAAALVDEGDHAAAARTVEQMEAHLPPTWDGWPRVAGLLCRCLRMAREDTALSADTRAQTARGYGEKALELLRKTVAAGRSDAATLRSADDLESLRRGPEFRDEFARLITDAEARTKNGGR